MNGVGVFALIDHVIICPIRRRGQPRGFRLQEVGSSGPLGFWEMHSMAAAERELLFGLIALQNGLVDHDQLVNAFRAWTRDKGRPLADELVAGGGLDEEQRALVEGLVAHHIKKHGGDPGASLSAINAGRIDPRGPDRDRRPGH